MTKNSIVNKILLYFLSVVTCVFVLLAFFASYWYKNNLINSKVDNLTTQIEIISDSVIDYMNNPSTDYIKYLSDYVDVVSRVLEVDIVLCDALNYVYLVSNDSHKNLLGKQYEVDYYNKFKINHISSNELDVYDNGFGEKLYRLVKPLYESGIYKGAITLFFGESVILNKIHRFNLIIFSIVLLSIFIISLFMYFLSRKILVTPIKVINSTAKRFALGDVYKRIEINSKDEIGELANSFNYMAESLEKIDSNRREFLSNVSHELRTPLTTIIGFLSGILDGIIPEENHMEKLKVVYDEVKRLSRLVNDLLDLTTMESGKFTLRFKIIELNSLIRYTVTNFEQEIKQSNINMEVFLEHDNVNVIADEDRLVQVLNNLIANAIKYCDDRKRINISAKIKNNKAVVCIFNTAKLLSEEEFNNIWVRFYKNDKSRTGKESTGLGLSIVRNIISQFREEIWVENRVKEEGVSFIFTLQLAN
ncbi:sensor histidine kinase [Candidatus Arthromitus sp. SFB-turkey]|uniref:sensor histidine kinase n=1 Tax=Candidatus Arthromitus sp. SFB-turkey TaxID=1840217 RepID=UPI0007F4D26A|nr:histidine kinase dimerization/phospho-acceptor domain-containing protein [Candidatus Arthromitus sp. SFB-turkey]OAT89948.1 two-component sensor histidine kinase [Candidatus Arthromitus sp. SFB-turkey]HJC99884.1 cell wall metabolism sensor histidine kinase WalK [Candidatus Dwaynia gallinarum]